MVIGEHLAKRGVLGRFAVDFVVVQDDPGRWTPYAIELNLRKGGTTHPFLTLQFLTDGTYEGDDGVFLTPSGSREVPRGDRPFRATRLKRSPSATFSTAPSTRPALRSVPATGVVLHMISCLTECGRVGLTAVGDSPKKLAASTMMRRRRSCARPTWRLRKGWSSEILGFSPLRRHLTRFAIAIRRDGATMRASQPCRTSLTQAR